MKKVILGLAYTMFARPIVSKNREPLDIIPFVEWVNRTLPNRMDGGFVLDSIAWASRTIGNIGSGMNVTNIETQSYTGELQKVNEAISIEMSKRLQKK